jgi:hypothetical protein
MNNPVAKRGRPKKANPMTAAERMRAYRKRKREAGMKSVSRWVPTDGDYSRYSDHRLLDARSLAMHCKIAQKISRDPELLNIANENFARWSQKAAEIADFITSISDDAIRLRSSSPFAGVLSAEERKRIYEAFGS